MSRLVCGWGVNDADYAIQSRQTLREDESRKVVTQFDCPFYKRWSLMIMRCHDDKFRARNPSYSNATICEEWKAFSSFRSWMESMPWQGNELDKDILGDGTYYSPATCCFVPKSVNVFWTNCTSKTGVLIGANFAKDRGNWVARCTIGNRKKTLGVFHSELEAHHLQTMALFKVNTGCREQEVCKLRWDWEISVPELGESVFLIPADFGGRHEKSGVKNGDERLVVLNSVAKSIIERQRGLSKEWVFPYNGNAMHRMNDSAWKKARVRAAKLWQVENLRPAHPGYLSIRIHDLKHTFGRRLRAAGVTEEDRKALLGHKNGSITSHYSGAELGHLIEAANMVSATDSRGPVLTILKRKQA